MPRRLPRFDLFLTKHVAGAQGLILRIESAMIDMHRPKSAKITTNDVELVYELAYLRVFLAWEILLSDVLLRLMCGFEHSGGQEPLCPGEIYFRRIVDAETYLLDGRPYILWHNPATVLRRAQKKLDNSRYEQVIASVQQRLEWLAAIRHRVVHAQDDAGRKFDIATMMLAGRRYSASRPGRFLRDRQQGSNPPRRWFGILCGDLENLAMQICS